jgi:hypothetical protein
MEQEQTTDDRDSREYSVTQEKKGKDDDDIKYSLHKKLTLNSIIIQKKSSSCFRDEKVKSLDHVILPIFLCVTQ